MNLATAFLESARKCAGKPAIFWGEEVVTYDDILAQSRALALELINKMGVAPGDRVAIWLKNCPEFVPVLFGILQAGAVVVPINNFLKPDEVNYILKDCGANVLISEAEMQEGTARLRQMIPGLQVFEIDSLGRSNEAL
ncbi:MAG: AMP-binding protein, partial [Limisphaerales bacterium]